MESIIKIYSNSDLIASGRFSDEEISIGRSIQCTIRISELYNEVSLHHATIDLRSTPGRFIDNDSTNGSYLGNTKISDMDIHLPKEYRITLGSRPNYNSVYLVIDTSQPRTITPPNYTRVDPGLRRIQWPPPQHSPIRKEAIPTPDRKPASRQIITSTDAHTHSNAQPAKRSYVAFDGPAHSTPINIQHLEARAEEVSRVIRNICETESPISIGLLSRRFAFFVGASRSSSRIQKVVIDTIRRHPDIYSIFEDDDENFVYVNPLTPETMTWYRTRTSDRRTHRDPRDIPSSEIFNASIPHMAQLNIDRDYHKLFQKIAEELGIARVGQNVSNRVHSALSRYGVL